MASFPDRLRELRNRKAVTQKAVAEYLMIRETSYQQYEYGRRVPNQETTIKLADYFDVSLDYIVGRSDNWERV